MYEFSKSYHAQFIKHDGQTDAHMDILAKSNYVGGIKRNVIKQIFSGVGAGDSFANMSPTCINQRFILNKNEKKGQ